MLPFDSLTRRGRLGRLAALCRSVLDTDYGIRPARVRPIASHSFNTVFRIDAPDLRAALRIGSATRIHPPGAEDIEARWLDELSAIGLTAPQNVPTADGRRWTVAQHHAVSEARVCTLFTWIDGVELRNRLTPAALRDAGALLARLHQTAATIAPSSTAGPNLQANEAIYLGAENLVSRREHPDRVLFAEAIARVQATLDRLWEHRKNPHLLHGDFGPHNILTMRGNLRPIDFQDLRVGYPEQDLGLTIADLTRLDPSLRAPFTEGYGMVEPLPDLHPELLGAFAASRSLNIMNLALCAPDTNIASAFDDHAERVRRWMTTRS